MKHHLSIFALFLAGLPTMLAAAETNAAPVVAEKPAVAQPVVADEKPVAEKPAPEKPAVDADEKPAEEKPAVAKPADDDETDDLLADDKDEAKADVKAAAEDDAKETVKDDDEKADAADDGSTNAVPAEVSKPVDTKFERYRTILDRMPFGPEPVGFDPDSGATGGPGGEPMTDEAAAEAMMAEEAQKMLAGVRISALNVTPSGTVAVGFTDSSKQPATSYYMKVGEIRDGWMVKSADAKEQSVTLWRDGVEGTLKLGEGAEPNAKGGKGGPGGRPGAGGLLGGRPGMGGGLQRPTNLNAFGGRPGLPQAATGGANGAPAANETAGDALARLRARRAEKDAARQAEAARATAAAELAKAEQAKLQAEREKAAAEREQQRQALAQIQEELRRQREAREQQNNEAGGGDAAPADEQNE